MAAKRRGRVVNAMAELTVWDSLLIGGIFAVLWFIAGWIMAPTEMQINGWTEQCNAYEVKDNMSIAQYSFEEMNDFCTEACRESCYLCNTPIGCINVTDKSHICCDPCMAQDRWYVKHNNISHCTQEILVRNVTEGDALW